MHLPPAKKAKLETGPTLNLQRGVGGTRSKKPAGESKDYASS